MSDTTASLIDELSSIVFLRESWRQLNKSNKASKGLSNISIKDFEDNLTANLEDISKQIATQNYTFSKVKALAIRKSNSNDKRPLRISEIKDRLVHKALSILLDKQLSKKFNLDNECSFAYRKGKNVKDAIMQMCVYYKQGYNIILEADIKQFFDTVIKSDLLTRIQNELPDNSINDLLLSALSQEIGNRDSMPKEEFEKYFLLSEEGIPQGNALSPLLANIYLADFDNRIIEGGIKMVRYADDFIIMCKTRQEAEAALVIAKEELENKLGLEIHPLGDSKDEAAKTRIVNPQMHKFSFLSIRFDGVRCWVKDKKVLAIIQRIEEITDAIKHEEGEMHPPTPKLLNMLTSLKNTTEGWIAAYHFVDLDKSLTEIDKHINRCLYVALSRMGFNLDKKSLEYISIHRIRRINDEKGSNTKAFVIGRKDEVLAINKYQRINTGIPYCHKVWERMLGKTS